MNEVDAGRDRDRDYGGGGPGKPPCWRTLKESCMGLGSVSLKINNQHTHQEEGKFIQEGGLTKALEQMQRR
jgi:hypothetical protein